MIPDSFEKANSIVRITHKGFADHEYEAAKLFFENYEIKQPSIPLLHPDFSNPLLLKLFCEGLSKKGIHEIPAGYEGISTIMNFYLDAVNEKLFSSNPLLLKLNVVSKTAKLLAGKIAESRGKYLLIEEALEQIVSISPKYGIINPTEFLYELVSEGLLTQNLYWVTGGNYVEGVYISYERFSDHLVCDFLLDKYLTDNVHDLFASGMPMREYLKNESVAYYNQGLIEALSIQLPERTGYELYELADYAKKYSSISTAFIESIIWRKRESINKKVLSYVNDVAVKTYNGELNFINAILLITSDPTHIFNADFIHEQLSRLSLADRDAWWTRLIHNQYSNEGGEASTIKRIIDWAWSNNPRQNISDESIRLMSQSMIWLLSSTNRELRDAATKSIICLLKSRIDVLIKLIEKFSKVNDPYILQRLYAIAYGCAVNSRDIDELQRLGNCIYKSVFATEFVIPDILLRDYARSTVEYAIYIGAKFNFDLQVVRPPYKSILPIDFPTDEEVENYEYDYKDPGFKDHYWSANSILRSMQTNTQGKMYGDFGRYVFESAFDGWRDIDVNGLSNLAVKWIFEKYGYNVDKHGVFDREIGKKGYSRHYVMEERIGKKYQWIAFYELLALVSDNCDMYEDSWGDSELKLPYNGPWNPYVRDIDPTITIRGYRDKSLIGWWNNVQYSNWEADNSSWIFDTTDLPNPLDMITMVDNDNIEWLVLETSYTFTEPAEIGNEEWEQPTKELWYQLRSYLVEKKDETKTITWAKNKNFMGRWMPESRTIYSLFNKEYHWAPACEVYKSEEYGGLVSEIYDRKLRKHIADVYVTTIQYLWEEQFDASKDSLSFFKPNETIFKKMDLVYGDKEGYLVNRNGEVVCFDPSANSPTRSCLLVKKKDFLNILDESGLCIFWTVLGEKAVHKLSMDDYKGRLNISGVISCTNDQFEHFPYYNEERPKNNK